MEENNVVICLKDNEAGRKASERVDEIVAQYMDLEGTIITCVFSKEEFDNCIYSGAYKVGFILEKIEDTPMSYGAIRSWKKLNPDARVVLIMADDKIDGAKPSGLYEKGYYDGLFMKDFCGPAMISLIKRSRTKEEAYSYYKVDEFEEKKKAEELLNEAAEQKEKNKTIEPAAAEDKTGVESDAEKTKEGKDAVETKPSLKDNSDGLTTSEDGFSESREGANFFAEGYEEDENKYVEGSYTTEFLNLNNEMSLLPEEEVNNNDVAAVEEEELFFYKEEEERKENAQDYIIQNPKTRNERVLKHLDDEAFLKKFIDDKSAIFEKKQQINKDSGVAIDLFMECMELYADKKEAWLKEALLSGQKEKFTNDAYDFIESKEASEEEKQICYSRLINYVWGYDVLTPLINLDEVMEIHVTDFDKIRVKTNKGRHSTLLSFLSKEHYLRFVKNIERRNAKRKISEGMTSTYTDRDFSKENVLQISIIDGSTTNTGVPELVIRKYAQNKLRIKGMIGEKLSVRSAACVINAILGGRGILLCGPSGCGSTTLLNAMIEYIPRDKNGVVLQHKDELTNINHPEVSVRFPVGEVRDNDGKILRPARSLEAIADEALYRDVDYYIMSDVRGNEALSLFNACNTGFTIWANVRASTCEEAMNGLANLVVSAEPTLLRDNVCQILASKISTIILMKDLRVVEIKEITEPRYDMNMKSFTFKEIDINGSTTYYEEKPEKTNV